MRPAVAVIPPNEIIFTSSKFEQMRQTQKTTPMIKKGREKERFIILVFYVVFKHTEDIYPLLFYTKSFRGAKIIQTKVKTNSSGIYLVSFVSAIGTNSISIITRQDWKTYGEQRFFMVRIIYLRIGQYVSRP